tara:strand:- start:50 stop:2011 length:1962 start_codon:yes stop_codon:yes gene_type:complete
MIDFKEFLIEMADDDKFKQACDDALSFDLTKKLKNGKTIDSILSSWAVQFDWKFDKNWYATYANGTVKCRIDSSTRAPNPPGGEYNLLNKKFTDIDWKDPLTDKQWENPTNSTIKGIGWFLWWIKHKGAKFYQSGISATSVKGKLGDNPKTYFYEQVAAGAFLLFDSNKNHNWFKDPIKNQELLVGVIGSKTGGSKTWKDETWQEAYPNQVATIANGVYNFLKMSGNVGSSGYRIIHDGVDSYYKKIRSVVDVIDGESVKRYALDDAKDNTADIVLYSTPNETDLYDPDNVIQDQPDIFGRLKVLKGNVDIGWVMQVSLKLSEKDAQVGKLSQDFEASGFLYVSDGDNNLTHKADVIDKYYDLLPSQQNESFIRGFKDFVRTSWDFVVGAFNKALGTLRKIQATLIKYLSPSKVKKEAEKLLQDYLKDYGYLVEVSQKQKVDAILAHTDFQQRISDDTNNILDELSDVVKGMGISDKVFITNLPSSTEKITAGTPAHVRSLLCNQVSFRTLLSYYRSIKGNYIKELITLGIKIGLNAVMGESLLPVVKLYGAPKGVTKNWTILRRDDKKYDVADKIEGIPIGGLTIWRSRQSGSDKKHGYYSINQYSLMSYVDEPEYLAAQLRTGGSAGGFAFFIEANKTVDRDYLEKQVKND